MLLGKLFIHAVEYYSKHASALCVKRRLLCSFLFPKQLEREFYGGDPVGGFYAAVGQDFLKGVERSTCKLAYPSRKLCLAGAPFRPRRGDLIDGLDAVTSLPVLRRSSASLIIL